MYTVFIQNDSLIFKKDNIDVAIVKKDSFNSNIFDIVMFNIEIIDESKFEKDLINLIIIESKKHGVEHLSVKINTSSNDYSINLQENNFLLVDTLVSYMFDVEKTPIIDMEHKCLIRKSIPEDLDYVKEYTRNSFKIDRFHNDPYLDNKLADEYYATWIENSFYGYSDYVVIGEVDKLPVGFTTLHYPKAGSDVARMVLSAVSPLSRGKGVYTSIIYEGLVVLRKVAKKIILGTQIDNFPVQKNCINLGFKIFETKYIYHLKIQ